MSWLELCIVAAAALWLLGALVFLRRHKHTGCGGCCERCPQQCNKKSSGGP